MQKRYLGPENLAVSTLGLGCMGMSDFYGGRDEREAIRTLHRALDLGITLFDTADVYGLGANEELVAKALHPVRSRVILATKFGNVRAPDGTPLGVNGRPEYVTAACDRSLSRLKTDTIDLYYQHRVDPQVPIEETVGAMKRLVEAGKVRHLGLSEAAADTIRRAHRVHPITAVQTEYSLWTRDVEAEILPVCRELGIGFVPYSPLGRGFLTGSIRRPDDLDPDDHRRISPRFTPDHLTRNLRLLDILNDWSQKKSATPAQLALAWLLSKGPDIVPIPGTKRVAYLEENTGAMNIQLSAEEMAELDAAFPPGAASGARYPEQALKMVNR